MKLSSQTSGLQIGNNGHRTYPEGGLTFRLDGIPVIEGHMLGKRAIVLSNSGSNIAIARRAMVPDNCLSGKTSQVLSLDGSVEALQEAVIQVDTPYCSGGITAPCMEEPIYDLVFGNLPGVLGLQTRYWS